MRERGAKYNSQYLAPLPAHTLKPDEYNPEFPGQQDELLEEAIRSLTKLRLALSAHPSAEGYKPPEWLDGDKIVFY